MGRKRTAEEKKAIGDGVAAAKARNYTGLPTHKACSACGTWLPRADFTVTRRPLRDGTVRLNLSSRCKRCSNDSVKALRQGMDPKVLQAQNKQYYQNRRRKARKQTNRRLALEPFKRWLQSYPFDLVRLARAAGMDDSTLVKLRDGSNGKGGFVSEDTVDMALLWSEDGTTLYDLYPE